MASDNASDSLNDATLQQIEDKMQIESFTVVHESLGEGEGHHITIFILFTEILSTGTC